MTPPTPLPQIREKVGPIKIISLIVDGQEALSGSAGINFGPPECKHTPCPSGYLAWHAWAERKSKTHSQVRCPSCGLWFVWLPKGIARKVNARDRREEKKFLEDCEHDALARASERVRELEVKLARVPKPPGGKSRRGRA